MKNKLLEIVLIAALSLQLIGCSSDKGTEPELSVESSSNSSALDAKNDNSNDEDIQGEIEVTSLVSEYLLPHEDSEEYLYVVDEKGDYAGKYNYQEISDIAEENGHPTFSESNILAESASIFFYYYIEYLDPDDHGDSITHIWAIDMNSRDFAEVTSLERGYDLRNFEIYDGNIYVTSYQGSMDEYHYVEDIFSLRADAFSFIKSETSIENVLKALENCRLIANRGWIYGENGTYSISRAIDEYGFVVAAKAVDDWNSQILKIKGDGTTQVLADVNEPQLMFAGFDGKYALFHEYPTILDQYYKCIDLETGEIKVVSEDYISIVNYKDGKIYYRDYDEMPGSNEFTLYEYDCATGEEKAPFTRDNIPGAGEYLSREYGVVGDNMFIEDVDGYVRKWYRLDEDGAVALDETGIELNTMKYGTVLSDYLSARCPRCDTLLRYNYDEYFQLSDEWSEYANVINTDLKEKHKTHLSEISMELHESDYEDCATHKEYPSSWQETQDYYVKKADVIGDYLAIDCSGVWYGGGAHGLPWREQLVYDLTTGEELHFQDLYSGSEEDFKKLVAEKIKEDFENCDDSNKYFASDADSAYSAAYESVSIEDATVFFREKSLVYSFAPYEIGPYSSGFIEVEIPYEEIFGKDTLTHR
jgi:hypothetical protein